MPYKYNFVILDSLQCAYFYFIVIIRQDIRNLRAIKSVSSC